MQKRFCYYLPFFHVWKPLLFTEIFFRNLTHSFAFSRILKKNTYLLIVFTRTIPNLFTQRFLFSRTEFLINNIKTVTYIKKKKQNWKMSAKKGSIHFFQDYSRLLFGFHAYNSCFFIRIEILFSQSRFFKIYKGTLVFSRVLSHILSPTLSIFQGSKC